MQKARVKSIKKTNKRKGSRSGNPHEKNLELSLIRTYPNQAVWQVIIPAEPLKFTTTVTTGVLAQVYSITQANVAGFATRFGSTFVEYRIIRAKFMIRFFSSINPGLIQFWIDEKSNATPTVAEAFERATLSCSASAVDTRPLMKWVCADPLDLQYQAIATTFTAATFKMYTDNTNFGSSIVATDYLEVVPHFEFQFRGLKGV